MRCLYCGKQLALFRRLTGSGEFCSDAHKQSYHEEYNRLALTRLIAAQSKPEEKKPGGSSVPSTMQLAAGDRNPAEGRTGGLHPRWGDLPNKSRMLEPAPAEAPPPAAASFLIRKPEPAGGALPAPTTPALESIPVAAEPGAAGWTPVLATSQNPPEAEAVDAALLPFASNGGAAPAIPQVSETPFPASETSMPPEIPARPISGLRPRPAIQFDPLQFMPDTGAEAQPAYVHQFEDFRFAVMIFGAPAADVLGDSQEALQPEERPTDPAKAAKLESPPELSTEAPRPEAAPGSTQPGGRQSSTDPKRPSAVRVKLAALAAAMPPEPPKTEAEGAEAPQEGHKPRPKLPTIPAPRQRTGPQMPSGMPSVLAPLEPETAESRSLWGALRKYIKK